jgi:hypothetical protein
MVHRSPPIATTTDPATDGDRQMPYADAFALKNSGLNEFLFAEVGIETNGSPLTILSVLARLGRDPWAEAAGWTKLPSASIIDGLADCISQMPLRPPALAEARMTAGRLMLLLPAHAKPFLKGDSMKNGKSTAPRWVPIAVFLAALAFGIGFEMIPSNAPIDAILPLTSQVIKHPQPPAN